MIEKRVPKQKDRSIENSSNANGSRKSWQIGRRYYPRAANRVESSTSFGRRGRRPPRDFFLRLLRAQQRFRARIKPIRGRNCRRPTSAGRVGTPLINREGRHSSAPDLHGSLLVVVCHHGSRRRGAARAPGGARRRGIGGPARYPKPLERTDAHWRFDGSVDREERCCRLVARLQTKLSALPTNRHPRSRVRDAEPRVGRLRRDSPPLPSPL